MDTAEIAQSEQLAIAIFREHGGMLRTGEALQFGIHPRTLYSMRDSRILERISRGSTGWPIYRPFRSPTWYRWLRASRR